MSGREQAVRVRARRRIRQCTTKIIRKWAMKGERKIRDGTEGFLTKRTAARDLCNERRARAAVQPPKERRGVRPSGRDPLARRVCGNTRESFPL